ncbi:MFS transporter [Salinithrix halophila]|uniref:MFS transporter n=1 Tax=Salinithrix halophila TaxID=1485204 RepID=A0ABV8JFK6_9BACL
MIFNVLKERRFRNYFFSDIISGFGVGMSTIGANWFIMDQTGSLSKVGLMLTLNVLASFAISPLFGIMTDRFNRKTIIHGTNWSRVFALLAIASALLFSDFNVIYLYLFTVVNGMGWSIYLSASRSLVQELLSEKDLLNGNSLIEISLQVGMFVAGGVSGVLYKLYGFEIILVLNAIAFVISSLFLHRIKYTPTAVENNKEKTLYINFKEGIDYLRKRPSVFILGVASIIPIVSVMVFNVVLPGYVSGPVNGDSVVFGLSDMFYGIGGLLSGFVAAPLAKKLSNIRAILIFFFMAISIQFAWVFNHYVWFLYVGCVLFGLSNSSLRIVMNTVVMKVVSKSFMGRAMSVWLAISFLLQCVSAIGLGALMDHFSPSVGFIGIGSLMIFGLVIAFYAGLGKEAETSKVPWKDQNIKEETS